MKIFKTGFVGASLDEVTTWVGERSEGAKSICVPFAGSGKDIASMVQVNPGVTIRSWDPQFLSHAVIDGIFAGDGSSNVTEKAGMRLVKGVMFETRPLKNMPDECAGWFDWVVKYGTLFDKAVLTSVTVRSTMIGRMTHWNPGDTVWDYVHRFNLARERFKEWVGLNGKFIHTMGSVYDDLPIGMRYDVCQVDPPKVISSRDVYSKGGFAGMNHALGGPEIPEWHKGDVIDRFRHVLDIDAERFLFLYVSEVKPDFTEVRRLLQEYGTIKEEREFGHTSKIDIAWLLEKDK